MLGNISNSGALVVNRTGTLVLEGLVSGSGSLTQMGAGTLVLVGNNNYTGVTTIADGTLQLGDGGSTGSVGGNITNNGALVFNRSDHAVYAGVVSGTGTLTQAGSGSLDLSGAHTYTGLTNITAGKLLVSGSLAGAVNVANGGLLGGTGTIAGTVNVANGGTLAPGSSPGTLAVGSLVLNSSSLLDYELGLPNEVGGTVNDWVNVSGNLTLDGSLNISNAGGFGSGVYRLFDYGGTLTDNGLVLASLPAGFSASDLILQTSTVNQVNLLVSVGGFGLQFWDGPNTSQNGVIDGGTSVWNTTTSRWTNGDGALNTRWLGSFAVFHGTAGTVTLGQDITFTGAQFRSDGYLLEGAGFQLRGSSADTVLRVDSGITATVNAILADDSSGATRLVKTDLGTLALGGANTFTGGIAIQSGRLQIAADSALGAAAGALGIDGGILLTTANIGISRPLTLGSRGGNLEVANGTTLTYGGAISGVGTLEKLDAGTLILSGANSYSGGTRLGAGTLAISALGNLGDLGGGLTFAGGTLRLDASFNLSSARVINLETAGGTINTNGNTSTLSQAMQGAGGFTKSGAGTLILSNDQLYTGGTTVATGTLQVGTGGTAGSLLGAVVNNGTLTFARSDVLGYDQVVSGSGNLIQQGPGRLILLADHTYTGGTTISGGVLQFGNNTTAGSVQGNIVDNAALLFARNDALTFAGNISGTGTVTQQGTGELTFTGTHSYTGGTTIATGTTLRLGNGGTTGLIAGNVSNAGFLIFDRSNNVAFAGEVTGSGTLEKLGAGELLLTGNISQAGTATVTAGTLRIGDAGNDGTLAGDITNNASLVFNRAGSYTLGSTISGTGTVEQRGPGTLIVARSNTYTGGTLISGGTLQVGEGGAAGMISGNITNNGALSFNRDGSVTYAGVISGSGTLAQMGTGSLRLTAANTLTGLTTISNGELRLDGSLAGAVQVGNGSILSGIGSIGGLTTVAGGGHLAPGNSAGTLTLASLTLNDTSELDFELGVPNLVGGADNDLISVGGNLTLDGHLNIVNLGGFSDGVYRLFNYGGALTNFGVLFGTLPAGTVAGDLVLQTNVANQVNLIVSQGGLALQFWDGANTTGDGVIAGGTGSWNNATSTWTNSNGTVNAPWQGGFAAFQGAAGTVTFSDDVVATGMQFLTNGYTITGGALGVTGTGPEFVVRTDPGVVATVQASIRGASKLIKRDAGTLVLSGSNTYTGGTRIEAGTLRLTTLASLGDGGLEMDGGILTNAGNISLNQTVTLDGSGGTFGVQAGTTQSINGVISGTGRLTKTDTGSLILSADNTYTGGTTLSSGFMRLGAGGTTGSVQGDIVNNGSLILNRSNQIIMNGTISGSGSLTKLGAGVALINAANTYTGGTILQDGVLDATQDNRLGAASGGLTFDGGILHTGAGFVSARTVTINAAGGTIEDEGGATFSGVLQGTGGLSKNGAGTTILTNENTYTGGTTINSGTLQVGSGGTVGSLQGDITNNGALLFNRSDATTFAGVISGTGEVSVAGGGTLTLSGTNTYSGVNGTQVRGGSTLAVANNGNLGAATTRVLLRNSTLRLTSSFTLSRSIVLDGSGGNNQIDTQGNTVTVDGVISGTTSLEKDGSGTLVMTADNTYVDGTTIAAGTLRLGNGGTTGSVLNNITNNGALIVNRSNTFTYAGALSGTGSLTQAGTGTLILTGDNTHSGGTVISAGTLQVGSGSNEGSLSGAVNNNAALVFNRNDAVEFAGIISGSGTLRQQGSGELTLSAANTFTGLTTVAAGSLLLNGSLAGAALINAGARLSGIGSIAGAVTVANGGIFAPGSSPGTLTMGSLILNSTSQLNYDLGLPDVIGGGVNDLAVVNGNLTLDGNLAVSDAGGFGNGVYRLISYSGSLTDNGLVISSMPGTFLPTDSLIQTSIANQVNLIVSKGGFALQFWDGANLVGNGVIDGGTSVWNTTDAHWTDSDGDINAPWQGGFAVFQGSAGTVTLAQNATFSGAQFRTNGYVINGTGLSLAASGETVLRVDPSVTATVAVNLIDGSTPMALIKTDLGTLVLTGSNTFSGGTTVRDGTLRINQDTALGAASGGVELQGSTLAGSASLISNRSFQLTAAGGTFAPTTGTTMTLAGAIAGSGSLFKQDGGTLVLSGVNTHQGGTRLNAGILGIRADANLGAASGALTLSAGILRLDANVTLPASRDILLEVAGGRIDTQANTVQLQSALHGDGGLTKLGSGRLILSGANGYLGGTTVLAGTLQVGAGGISGRVLGDVVNQGTLVFARSDVLGYDGAISGNGGLVQQGPGRLVLTGNHSYTGGTTISGGVLQLGSNTLTGSVVGNIVNNASLIFARSIASTFAGVISGSGTVTQQGPGKLTLTGNNSYTGGTTVTGGTTLQVGAGGTSGALTGNVSNQGTLLFNRSDDISYAGNVTGTGAFIQQGPGQLTLLGSIHEDHDTTISAGALKVGNGGTSGELAGDVLNQGTLIFHRSDTYTFSDVISGSGLLEQRGPGTLLLTGANTYSGGTLISAGTLQVGSGVSGRISGDVSNQGLLVFGRDDSIAFNGVVSGSGRLTKSGAGILILGADNTYTGVTIVSQGTLKLTGSVAGDVQVNSGATLSGHGNAAGLVTVANGGHLAPGDSPGTLYAGSLLLNSGSLLDYELGLPDVVGGDTNDLIEVAGDLTLDGILNVTNAGGFGNGVYRLINYGGTLTNNGLSLGTLPSGIQGSDALVQTSVDSEINLVINRGGYALQFWDGNGTTGNGVVDGGTSVWDNSQSHWTNASGGSNVSWQSGFAVFSATPGTVTLADNVSVSGMQFHSGGYRVSGASNTIAMDASEAIIRVDVRGEANIDAQIVDGASGPARLIVRDRCSLTLSGANTYSGGTQIDGAFLQITNDGNLGAARTEVAFNGGTLSTTSSFSTTRAATLGKGHGIFNQVEGSTLTWNGLISGVGGLNKTGAGTLILTADNTYSVGTFVGAGTLQVARDSNLGQTNAAIVMGGGTLRWGGDFVLGAARNVVLTAAGRFDTNGHTGTIAHEISGEAGLIKQGQGRLILAGNNSYAGNTAIESGTLQIGNGGNSGSVLGDIQNNGTLAFARGNDLTFAGRIAGSGSLVQQGAGTLVLSANHSYLGGTTIASGKLMLGQGGASGSVLGNIANQGELIFNRTDTVLYEGVVSGSGALSKRQGNTLVLSANHTYTGGTTIEAGQLRLGNGGSSGGVLGDVVNRGELAFFRSGAVAFAGTISGTGSLRQLGNGTLTLSAANSYSGGTFLDDGIVSVAQDSALGAASGGVTFDGGTLQLTASFDSNRSLHLQTGNGAIETVGSRNKFSQNIDGNGALLKLGDGVLILNYGGSHTGGTQVRAGTLVVGDSAHPGAVLRNGPVGIAAGASLGGYGSIIGAVTNEGLLAVGNALPALASEPDAVFTIAGNLANLGTVSLVNGVAADQLVIKQGAFIAFGGVVRMETVLNGGELKTQSDQLIVDGVKRGDNGTTGLQVIAVGGAGQVTDGDGIRLVDVTPGGVSAAGAFGLVNRVVAGSHEYLLFQGGLSNPNDGDWYLRSESSDPIKPLPILRPEVGGFLGNRFMAERLMVHTLHQRQGEPDPTLASDDEERGPAWANVYALEANTQTADGLVGLRNDSWRFQAGLDVLRRHDVGGGTLRAGAFVQYAQADTDTQAALNPARGNAQVTGYGVGVYATWMGDPERMLGAYVDGWLQYNQFDNEVDGSAGYRASYDAKGWAASLEAGYAIALGKRIVLQPQLQYVRVNLDTDGLIDSSHTQIVDLSRSDWVARIGARLYAVPNKPYGLSPFVEVNWWRRAGNASMSFNTDQVDHLVPKSLPTLDVGVQGEFAHGWNGWLRLGSDLSDERYQEISGSAGVRYQW